MDITGAKLPINCADFFVIYLAISLLIQRGKLRPATFPTPKSKLGNSLRGGNDVKRLMWLSFRQISATEIG